MTEDQHSHEQLAAALRAVTSAISRCEKALPKFAHGTSQHTLLVNRLKALHVAAALLTGKRDISKEELAESLRPISSIIAKCETAQRKHAEGSAHYTRFSNMIKALELPKALIKDEISKRG